MASERSDDDKLESLDKVDVSPPSPTASTDEKIIPAVTALTPPPPVQDGGTRAWLQVVGSFLIFTNLWGFTFAFGSFQSYYELHLLSTQSPSDISWIGTVSAFLLIFTGIISGRKHTDRYDPARLSGTSADSSTLCF